MENRKDLKGILLVIFIIISVTLTSFIIYDKFVAKSKNDGDKQETVDNSALLFYGNNSEFCRNNQYKGCNIVLQSIKPNTQNAYIVHIENNYVIYYDDGLYFLQPNGNKQKIDVIPENELHMVHYLTNGIIFNGDSLHYYYDSNGKHQYDCDFIYNVNDGLDNINMYITIQKGNSYTLYDVENQKEIVTRSGHEIEYEILGDFIMSYEAELMYKSDRILYTINGKEIAKLGVDDDYKIMDAQSYPTSGIMIYRETILKSYDTNGNVIN